MHSTDAVRGPHIRPLITVALTAVLLVSGVPGVSAESGVGLSALLRVEVDGFAFYDGTRDAVLTTEGWCPGFDQRLTGRVCVEDDEGRLSASGGLHTGLVGFDAARRVSLPPAGLTADAVSRRVVMVEVLARRAGLVEVVVDAAPAGGAVFALDDQTAVPAPVYAEGDRVVWTAEARADETDVLVFTVGYDTTFTDPAMADGVPAVSIRLDQGDSDVAAEHFRGQIPAPVGASVARVSEVVYPARVVGEVGPPLLEGRWFDHIPGQGWVGLRLSTTHQLFTRGDAPLLAFPEDWVHADYVQQGHSPGISQSTMFDSPGQSVLAGIGTEHSPFTDPPWFRVYAALGFPGDVGRGLLDGEAVRATYHAQIDPARSFDPTDEVPRNDDGRLVVDWDGLIIDQAGFTDSYADPSPGLPVWNTSAYLQSVWNLQTRMTGGDVDRRDHVPDPLPAVMGVRPHPEPEVSVDLPVPDGWQIVRIITLSADRGRLDTRSSRFNADGSAVWGARVADGTYWLESTPRPDGLLDWAWSTTVITEARPDEQVITATEFGSDPVSGLVDQLPPGGATSLHSHVVPDGQTLTVHSLTRTGVEAELTLGPGIHTVRANPDGTLDRLDTTSQRTNRLLVR